VTLFPAPRFGSPFIRILLCAFLFSFSALAVAQTPAESPTIPANTSAPAASSLSSLDPSKPAVGPAKSGEALQVRIERARALIAAHRLDMAASELESVRAATRDNAVRNITSIMLMSVYLEEGNYGRAEALLEENFQARASQKDESLGSYFALSGQAVNGARTHLARYRSFGISTNDTSLPAEAVSDLNRLRSLLERMVAQAKEISNGRRAYDSLSLLEDVLGLRLSLAKDSEDQIRWEGEYASAREALASSQTQIASLGGIPRLRPAKSPVVNPASPSPYSTKRVSDGPAGVKAPETAATSIEEQPGTSETVALRQSTAQPAAKTDNPPAQPAAANPVEPQVTEAGLLNAKATRKVEPRYPALAKQNGAAGLVRVHVIVDELGKVIAVSGSEGPMLLRSAAEEAARQWSFEVVSSDGRPTRLSGYIDFNFSL
jgi:TonB family protein